MSLYWAEVMRTASLFGSRSSFAGLELDHVSIAKVENHAHITGSAISG